MRVHAIQHLVFEDLGSFAGVLERRGMETTLIDATRGDFGDAFESDLVIILGGPISANDAARFPFLVRECELIEHRLKRGRPTLGICLGAQLMAKVLGARVYPMGHKEIGFSRLDFTEAGSVHPLGKVIAPVLHWHGEMFDLPEGAIRLASTDLCSEQAFSFEDNNLALQFHVEVRSGALERWLVGHIVEIEAAGIEPSELRAQANEWCNVLESHSTQMLGAWLDGLGTTEAR